MNRINIKYLAVIFFVTISSTLTAQQFRSSYFLNEFIYSHNVNPAFMPGRGYVSFPGLGHFAMGVQSNVGLSTFLFPSPDPNYALTTFMSSTVDADQFLKGLPDNSIINMHLNMTPLSFGFYSWGGFNTFSLTVNSNSMLNIPKEFFDFVKNGTSSFDGTVYHMEDVSINTNNYATLSFGHAREINERLSLGVKLNAYLGVAAVDARISQLRVSMSPDMWEIVSEAEMNISASGVILETEADELGNSLSGFDMGSSGLGGSGFGISLGAAYEVMDGLVVSAALFDLGYISWNSTIKANTRSNRFVFTGFEDLSFFDDEDDDEDDPNSLSNQLDDLTDDLLQLTKMYVNPDESGVRQSMPVTLNVGVEYKMPFYDRLSVGFLSHSRFNQVNPWTEGRFSANITPIDFLSFSVSYGVATFGQSLGWMLNLHPQGFNFFVGSDNMFTRVSPQFIPVERMSANIYMGMNITFGRR